MPSLLRSILIPILVSPEKLLWMKVEVDTADKLEEDLLKIGRVFQGLLSGYQAKDQVGGDDDVEDEGGAKEEEDFQVARPPSYLGILRLKQPCITFILQCNTLYIFFFPVHLSE